MEPCNAHYYATRDPLGAAGDFTTAPEISQMFGEMVGARAGRLLAARRGAGGRRLCRARARARHARRRCAAGDAHGRASRARCIWSRPARCCAPRRRSACPTRTGTTRIDDLPGRAAAARRQRILRRAAGPPMGRRRGAAGRRSRATRLAFDRDGRDPRGSRRRATPRSRAIARASRRARRRRADHRLWPRRSRRRRHAAGGARPSLCRPCSPTRASRI